MTISDSQIRENIRKNIVYYRKKCKLTQKALAEQLGLKNSAVSNWEQGANTPDIETLFELCRIFKIDVNTIYGCDAVSQSAQAINLSPKMESILNKARLLNDDGLDRLENYADDLVSSGKYDIIADAREAAM